MALILAVPHRLILSISQIMMVMFIILRCHPQINNHCLNHLYFSVVQTSDHDVKAFVCLSLNKLNFRICKYCSVCFFYVMGTIHMFHTFESVAYPPIPFPTFIFLHRSMILDISDVTLFLCWRVVIGEGHT